MRRFEPGDIDEISRWYEARGEARLPAWAFPPTGFIVPGVGAAFLFLTNSSVAFAENVVTNPAASSEARHAALVELGDAIMAEAKANGVKLVIGICKDDGIARRGVERYGMTRLGQHEIVAKEM